MKHLLDFQNIQKKEMENLIEEILKLDLYKLNQIKSLTLLQFNENSTRTRLSFAIAAKRLGIDIVESTDNISAKSKGEGLMHELETYQSMGIETVVIRSSENNIEDYNKQARLHRHNSTSIIRFHEREKRNVLHVCMI